MLWRLRTGKCRRKRKVPDLSALSNFPTTALGLSNLILVSPSKNRGYEPQSQLTKNGNLPAFPAKFLFTYEGENSVQLNSDITDHFIEDNTSISDQIALRPEIIKVNGFIGELNDRTPEALEPIKRVANKLTAIGAYTPQLSTTALIAYNTAFQLYQAAQVLSRSAVQAWTNTPANDQTLQQLGFQFFYAYWQSRILFTIQTPWNVFNNMAIQSLNAVQDAETRMVSDFEITFKKIRFAQTLTTVDQVDAQERLANQKAPVTNLGTNTPVQTVPLSDMLGQIA